MEEVAKGARSDGVHCARFEIDEKRARNVSAARRLIVVYIDAFQLQVGIAAVKAVGVDAVLVGNYLPELQQPISDALADEHPAGARTEESEGRMHGELTSAVRGAAAAAASTDDARVRPSPRTGAASIAIVVRLGRSTRSMPIGRPPAIALAAAANSSLSPTD